jgi:hypothetical protein
MQLINLAFLLVQLTFGASWFCKATIDLLWDFIKYSIALAFGVFQNTRLGFNFFLFTCLLALPTKARILLCLDSL